MGDSIMGFTGDEWREGMREMGYRTWLMYDLPELGEQVIYVIAFENGHVKVGQTIDWYSRENAHKYNKRVRGNKVVRAWWQRSSSGLEDERALIAAAHRLGGMVAANSREWFTGLDHERLILWAEQSLVVRPRPAYTGMMPKSMAVSA